MVVFSLVSKFGGCKPLLASSSDSGSGESHFLLIFMVEPFFPGGSRDRALGNWTHLLVVF